MTDLNDMHEDTETLNEMTYSMEEVIAHMGKTMRIAKKYYSHNHRRGAFFVMDHPISKRRGQKFLDELSPGLSKMINNRIARRKPGKVVEEKPAKRSGYRNNRRYRRRLIKPF